MRSVYLLVLALILAGCANAPATQEPASVAKGSAEEAGAVDGPAPVAPQEAYSATAQTEDGDRTLTVFPLRFPTNPAKAPYSKELTGKFQPQQCGPTGELPMGGLGLAEASQLFDLTEAFAPGDVFSYDINLTWTNTDDAWGEIHMGHQLGSAGEFWNEPTGDKRGEVSIFFTGQGYFAEEDFAGVFVMCWYGGATKDIPFKIAVTLTFAEGAVPAQTPVLVRVPDEATTLVARGVAIDPADGVLSHFRVFGPDDLLVCECALDPRSSTSMLALETPGDYVVLVDHTSNGFVSFGLDAPSDDLVPLPLEGQAHVLVKGANERGFDKTIELDLPVVPLGLGAWVFPDGFEESASPSAGFGQSYEIHVTNTRGEVLRQRMVGYVTYRLVVDGVIWTNDWYPSPVPGEWEFFTDHHAYAPGQHLIHVKSESLKGDVVLFEGHYVRPSA